MSTLKENTTEQSDEMDKIKRRKYKTSIIRVDLIKKQISSIRRYIQKYEDFEDYPEEDLEQLTNVINKIMEAKEILKNITE